MSVVGAGGWTAVHHYVTCCTGALCDTGLPPHAHSAPCSVSDCVRLCVTGYIPVRLPTSSCLTMAPRFCV